MEGAGFKASIRRRFAQHRNTRATILTSSSLLAIFIASLISKGCVSDVRFTRSRPGLKGSRIRILVTSPRFAFLRETNVSFLLFSASEPHSFSSPFCLLSSFFFFPFFFFSFPSSFSSFSCSPPPSPSFFPFFLRASRNGREKGEIFADEFSARWRFFYALNDRFFEADAAKVALTLRVAQVPSTRNETKECPWSFLL